MAERFSQKCGKILDYFQYVPEGTENITATMTADYTLSLINLDVNSKENITATMTADYTLLRPCRH